MKIMRYMWVGFFLLLMTGFISCASTKAQNPAKTETSSTQSPALSAQVATPQKNAATRTVAAEKEGSGVAATPAKAEAPAPQPAPPKPPERGMRTPLMRTAAPVPPAPAGQPVEPVSPVQFPPPSQTDPITRARRSGTAGPAGRQNSGPARATRRSEVRFEFRQCGSL